MDAAAEFIAANIGEFGLLGTNNVVPNDCQRKLIPPCNQEFTRGNHFRFGFDGLEFGNRFSSSATYWVEYGRASRSHGGFLPELRRALAEIYDSYGPLSISNTGASLGRLLIATAKEMGLSVEQITVRIDGHRFPPHDESLPHRVRSIAWSEFEEFARSFASAFGCNDPWLAFEAVHGTVSDATNICSTAPVVLHNHNYNRNQGKEVGPPNWSFVDHEKFTAVNRWLLASGRRGVPHILRWSPELLAAQLDSLARRSRHDEAPDASPSRLTPARHDGRGHRRQSWTDAELGRKMDTLGLLLHAENPDCDTAHYYPIHRLLGRLDLEYGCHLGQVEALYGRVEG